MANQTTGGDDRWWDLIERSREDVEDDEGQANRLVELMTAELSADDIVAFDKFLQERVRDAFRSDLWGIAYIMNGGCSDDGFDYFLGWLICSRTRRTPPRASAPTTNRSRMRSSTGGRRARGAPRPASRATTTTRSRRA